MYVLPCLSVVRMGYSRDLLDVCFGDQLAVGVGTCFHLDSLVETLGHSLKYFVLVE